MDQFLRHIKKFGSLLSVLNQNLKTKRKTRINNNGIDQNSCSSRG
jgi:hypothetical protein